MQASMYSAPALDKDIQGQMWRKNVYDNQLWTHAKSTTMYTQWDIQYKKGSNSSIIYKCTSTYEGKCSSIILAKVDENR